MLKTQIVLYIAFVQALIATLGSLFFSEILHFPPCILCWYQRICIYPLVLILAVCIMKKDKNAPYFVLPLSLIGLGISIYQNLLIYKVIPESLAPCTIGVSCTTKYIAYFGFVTIPFLSMLAFLVVTLCLAAYMWFTKKARHTNTLQVLHAYTLSYFSKNSLTIACPAKL